MNDKETGSFYTPEELIEYMVAYASARIQPKTILEPSAGDGRFVEPLKRFGAPISLVEFDSAKAEVLSSKFSEYCKVYCTDFIKYANQCNERYDLIIGNPPYIAKKKVPEDQCLETEKVLEHFDLDKSIFQNLAVYLKRKETLFEQYGALIEKRKSSALTATEEERFLQLHALFSRYGETDDFPAQLLSSDINQKLDSLIERMSRLLEKKD